MRDRFGGLGVSDELWAAQQRRQDRSLRGDRSSTGERTGVGEGGGTREAAETLTEPKTDMTPRRTVLRLSEGERDAIWQYDDPLWRAHYAWHPEDGWLYWTRTNGHWSLSSAAHDDVTNHSITLNRDANRYTFTEIARVRHWGRVLFTPDGEPLPVPDSMDTTLPREVKP